jgi:CheY-like chemotaxis protein
MLQTLGYVVFEATNGLEAVDFVKRICPDLVLMDLNLPVLDGVQAVQRIRQIDDCQGVPVVAMTAYDAFGMKEAALKVGCNEYLRRPFGMDVLASVVQRYL